MRTVSKNSNYVYVGSASDIHFLHPRNPTPLIVNNLIVALSDMDATKLDMMMFPGDFFDTIGLMSNQYLCDVIRFGEFLFKWAKDNNIILRVLEGTPSHDRFQSHIFSAFHANYPSVNFKYVKDLSLEYIEGINKTVLYIPDEWRHDTQETLDEVKALLKSRGLTKFDIGCFHGQMDYQLPPHVNAPKHDSSEYIKLCNDVIFIGHVHIYSRKKNIIAQGSFDRLSSGEEMSKGHVRVKIYNNHELDVNFVENVNAMRFDTVKCLQTDLSEAIKKIENHAQQFTRLGWIRIEAEKNALIFEHLPSLSSKFPLVKWIKHPVDLNEEKEQEDIDIDAMNIPRAITITPENIYTLLMERINQRCHDLEIIDVIKAQINEVI